MRLVIALVLVCLVSPVALAQEPPAGDAVPPLQGFPGLDLPGFNDGANVVPGEEVKFSAEFRVQRGTRKGTLSVRAEIAPNWHVYSITQPQEGIAPQASEIVAPKGAPYKVTGPFVPNVAADVHATGVFDVDEHYHEGVVVWTASIELAEGFNAESGSLPVAYSGQVCTNAGRCIPLDKSLDATFAEYVEVIDLPQPPADAASEIAVDSVAEPLDFGALVRIVCMAMLGGLILNLMPCVLPVIGLKVFGFIEQAGESRGKILALNLWYTAGLMLVFLILATLAAFLNLGWGEQFTHIWFKVGMCALVFAMALSFLGVWEIPLPGFVGTGASVELQQKEGAAGAFSKGVFTTILATPCSGPFLGPLFGYTLKQPPSVTYLIFASIGLGMASPYIVIGFFPQAVKYLPRPGVWMETFKQFMGFLLLGTVIFLFTTIGSDYFIATLTLLFGIWFACWWIGRAMYKTKRSKKVAAWLGGTAIASVIGWGAFAYLTPQRELFEWRDYSAVALQQAQAEGKTVMVDFTADWCLTCKINLKSAINTQGVKEVVEENDVLPLLADWTHPNDEIKSKLAELQSNSIPVLAIYPADKPEEVIILRDLITEGQVVDALRKAGRSRPTSKSAQATSTSAAASTTPAWFAVE